MNPHAALLLIRPHRGSTTITALQLLASAVTTLLAFAVMMLALAFWNAPTDEIGYPVLAFGLVALLAVPLVTLGTATARLAARSRDDRLATLRLLGVSPARVRGLAVAEVTVVAALGVLIGTAVSAALPFALSPLTVHGDALRPGELWLPWWATAALPPLLVLIAALSALLGLRRVVLSPLGVRMRQDAPKLSWIRVALALFVVGAAVLVTQLMSPGWGVIVMLGALGALTAVVLAVMAVLGLVGPFAVALVSRLVAARTSDPSRLVAARGIQDDPRAAWRSVSALALATFILIPAGSLLGYLDTISRSESRSIMTRDQLLLFADARTMLLALVAVSFVVVACQVAITQTAGILEDRELYVALDRIGMPRPEVHRMRRLRVTTSAKIAVIGAAVASVAVTLPLVFIAVVVAPLFTAAVVLVLLLGLLLIRTGVGATRPVLRRAIEAPERGE
ncbi:FtsX-like permease family protein [Leucobacter ruminantium]|uniref:Permease n=1 Tax=Leucobacter ruminantium TaxID=1289170 RepID=A0A939LX20_9MICO|nr:FtsX-like permease family protein [Leucobacter ruminantium]MBO1805681.1 permease [Leucobacter ruminantium]